MGVIFGLQKMPPRQERYQTIEDDIVDSADVCIIGSGAAGGVLAKELTQAGLDVVLLEKGGYYEGRDMNQREIEMMSSLWKNAGFNFDDTLRIAIAQGSCLGGSTVINDAVCFDPPQKVMKEWQSKSGATFTDEEIQRHTKSVNETIHVSKVTPDEVNRNNLMLAVGARRTGLQEHGPNSRNCVNCMQCGFCHLGCHYETKQDVLQTFLHQALQNTQDNKLRIYCNCDVDKLQCENDYAGSNDSKKVTGVQGTFRDLEGNSQYRIRVNAKVVIVSAGAIASSSLLLKNGIAQNTAGRGLSLHPAPFVIGDFDMEIKANQGVPMSYSVHDFGIIRKSDDTVNQHSYAGADFLIEGVFLPILQLAMALPVNPAQHAQLMSRINNLAMAGILVRDGNNGRISLTYTGRASISYDLGKREVDAIAKGVDILARMWFKLGAKRIIAPLTSMPIVDSPDDIPELVKKIQNNPKQLRLGSAHPQGGNKIGTNPDDSVVNPECRVHGFENLFVCDASVFPSSVGVNPQVTIMTVASMVAERISKQWDKYSKVTVDKKHVGNTCSIQTPMYCLRENLSELFDSFKMDVAMASDSSSSSKTVAPSILVNSQNDSPDNSNWSFDEKTLTITNNTHWKGIFPRNTDIQNTLNLYFGGFWKRFQKDSSSSDGKSKIKGVTHPFEVPVYADNKAYFDRISKLGDVIRLDYTGTVYQQFHDLLKVVDNDTILGKAYFGTPGKKDNELLTFCMLRKYPMEFMTESDHKMLYDKVKDKNKTNLLEKLLGIWQGELVSDSAWSGTVFTFRFYFDKTDDGKKVLKNDYLFGGILSGTAYIEQKEDHMEMNDVTEVFHDEMRFVNDDIVFGHYCSDPNSIFRWLPDGLSFLHIDQNESRVCLPYVLKRVGSDTAYRGYS